MRQTIRRIFMPTSAGRMVNSMGKEVAVAELVVVVVVVVVVSADEDDGRGL